MIDKILTTVLAVAGINGILAIFLLIAERFFANYGRVKITINDEKELDVDGGASLLSTLNSQKIFLPSACGGRGTCGFCKCRVTDGVGPLLPTETPLLDADEIADQIRIACQVKVKQSMAIRIPGELFNIREFKATVEKLSDLTYDIKRIRLKMVEPKEIKFIPGQYVQLYNKPYPGVKESVNRAYSIASPATGTDGIDLMVRLVPDGICTTWVHRYLKEGEEVKIVGPMGDFRLHEGGEMVMIAGGSGMAPMIPLLDALAEQESPRKITYFFGALSRRDLFYTDEMKTYEKKLSQFQFIPALSEPRPEDHWEGETGLITLPLENYLKEKETAKLQAYLCGSPGMINACINVMEAAGVPRDQIFFDPFA